MQFEILGGDMQIPASGLLAYLALVGFLIPVPSGVPGWTRRSLIVAGLAFLGAVLARETGVTSAEALFMLTYAAGSGVASRSMVGWVRAAPPRPAG